MNNDHRASRSIQASSPSHAARRSDTPESTGAHASPTTLRRRVKTTATAAQAIRIERSCLRGHPDDHGFRLRVDAMNWPWMPNATGTPRLQPMRYHWRLAEAGKVTRRASDAAGGGLCTVVGL
jgi:hypothetical protein